MNKTLKQITGTLWEKKLLVLSVIFVLAVGAGIASFGVRAAPKPLAIEEITPTPEQQKPIQDLIAEQVRSNQGYQDKIEGAVRTLMAFMKDPVTGETGLKPTEWTPQSDGKGGVKLVSTKRPEPKPEK